MRTFVLGLAALMGVALVGRADDTKAVAAGDLVKYVPADGKFFVHVNPPQLFASEMVRKVVPMVFDRYGDQIVGMMALAKQFNPNSPEIPEAQAKDAIKKMADPKTIAQAFDVAKDVVTDIVVSGSMNGEKPDVVVLIKCQFFTAEMAEMMANLAGANPQMKIEKMKKAKGTVYAIAVPNVDEKVYLAIPEAGVAHITMSEAKSEGAFAAASKPDPKLAALMTKRDKNDFIFATGLGTDDADYATMAMNLTLGKDIGVKMAMEYKDEKKAAEEAKDMTDKLKELVEQMKGVLGDKGAAIKESAEKTKVTADGKKVNASISIPGAAVEKLLSKD
ncbi:MAG: hypothetical protein K1X57_11270 [Gemmataceae bacterium]|nr:hypothetical protein [Gemmataceae bacterium]